MFQYRFMENHWPIPLKKHKPVLTGHEVVLPAKQKKTVDDFQTILEVDESCG